MFNVHQRFRASSLGLFYKNQDPPKGVKANTSLRSSGSRGRERCADRGERVAA